MKVKELIAELERFDEELEVLLYDQDYEGLNPIFRVEVWDVQNSKDEPAKEYLVIG